MAFFPYYVAVMLIQRRLYRDQLGLSERHLDSLLSDTTSALNLLAGLSESFKTVESETTAFQAQCEDLLADQKRIRDLADEVGTDLQYYAYLEPLTRRLNAPGAGRLVRSDDFLDMLLNLNTCIDFMDQHVSFRPIPPPISCNFVAKLVQGSKRTTCHVHLHASHD
jgi:hypothetical protein